MKPHPDQWHKLSKNDLLTLIYEQYGRKLYSYAIMTWRVNEDVAWDLVYKTVYKAAETYDKYKFETEQKFMSFLFRIFINLLRNHYRDNKAFQQAFTTMDEAEINSFYIKEQTDPWPNKKLNALNEALEQMEEWERVLLLMRSEGHAYSEIAKYVDKPENQLKVYYQRLKEQLAKKLNGEF